MRRLSLLIAVAALLGCRDEDFNRPELLKAPRILAMRAEPPQPSFGNTTTLSALVYQPRPEADAADCAAGGNPWPTYRWSWCPLPTSSSNGFACPVGQAEVDAAFAALGIGPAPALDLGDEPTATLRNPFPAAFAYALCAGTAPGIPPEVQSLWATPAAAVAAGQEFRSICDMPNESDPESKTHPLSIPVTVRLTYTPPCGSPPQDNFGPEQTASFTVHLPTDEALPPNQNPVTGDIYAIFGFNRDATVPLGPEADAGAPAAPDAAAAPGTIDAGEAIDGGEVIDGGAPSVDAAPAAMPAAPDGGVGAGTVYLPRDKRVGLWLDVPLSSAEFVPRPGLLDEVETGKVLHFERLGLLWFAEAGSFGGAHGGFGRHGGFQPRPNAFDLTAEDEANLDRGRQTQWAPPRTEDYAPNQARVVVVLRDSRGGVTWTSTLAQLEDRP